MAGARGSGGYGGGAGGSWGSFSGGTPPAPVSETETLTLSEAITVSLPLTVVGAISLNPFLVRLDFSHPVDLGFGPTLTIGNYSIFPLLTVTGVNPSGDTRQLLIDTSEQGGVAYTLTVAAGRSTAGDLLDLANNTAVFAGFPIAPSFFATAQSRTKVQLTFSQEMTQDAALTDPASYTLTDLQGAPVPITAVNITGPTPISRVRFTLGAELDPGGYYVATVSTAVTTIVGLTITPDTDLFQWQEMQNAFRGVAPMVIPIENFTGEVTSGLLGQPAGQVFFSPSLEALAPNSSIQVDDVQVCTKAFDVYTPPSIPDPNPLTTWSAVTPNSVIGTEVLYASFDRPNRMQEVQINLQGYLEQDTYTPPVDGPADATLDEPLDPNFISYLNNPFWETFGGAGTTFILADNLAPIPPGGSSNINLQP